MLTELHIGHPGLSRMKSQARGGGLVAWFGWCGGGRGKELFGMSASTTITNISNDSTAELANQTLNSAPC